SGGSPTSTWSAWSEHRPGTPAKEELQPERYLLVTASSLSPVDISLYRHICCRHGTGGEHGGRVQRGGGAPAAPDPGRPRRRRTLSEGPRRAARPRAAARIQAPSRAEGSGTRGCSR